MRVEGGVAAVFGGASGLGEASARRLAAGGARVVVADLDAERASAVAAEVGGVPVACDVTDEASVEHAIAEARKAGELRVAVNTAGIGNPTKLVARDGPTPLRSFAKVIEVNLLGTINVLRCAAGAMLTNEPLADGELGVCVNTASIAAYEGQIGQVAYAASKAGVAGLALPVARELAASAIRVVAIAPGLFDTPLLAGLPAAAREALAGSVPYPPRLGDPAEYAALVEHIVVNTMLNGETIRLDGALRMGPG
ncbi:MAG TPA: SDR family NAD(P)-dependent oxidoreductase [Solirubrobacterales bacterium]|nr:SDR family NAD(P)-dependent oxidoreductase [Solirubrobacterales bacterium]